jgi:hypothetical protein
MFKAIWCNHGENLIFREDLMNCTIKINFLRFTQNTYIKNEIFHHVGRSDVNMKLSDMKILLFDLPEN